FFGVLKQKRDLGISKTIGSFETKTDVEISSYPKYHVAISPDGKHVVTFDTDTLELSTCMIDSLDQAKTIKYDALSVDTTLKLVWSLAVSNSIDTHETEILIALSCFDEHTMMLNQNNNNIEEGQGSYDNRYQRIITNDEENCYSKKNYSETWIFSTRHTKRITTTIDEIGGLVKFLNNDGKTTADDNNHASVIVLNATGIYKTTFNVSTTENELKNNGMMAKIINSIDDINNMLSLFFNDLTATPLEEFSYPPKIQMELKKLYQNISCLELLSRSIENDYFLVEDYKNRIQVVEMYNLNTSKLDMIFHQHEDIVNTSVGHGSPAVSISTHKTLLAYCRGSNFMSIYLMENSLEIASRQFNHLEKILSIDFVNDDESLLIIAVEKERSTPVIIVWDLFTYFNDSIRILKDSSQVFPSSGHRLVRSSGKILLIDEMGKLKSILKDESLKYLLKPNRTSNELIELPLQELYESEWDQAVAHTVFDQNESYISPGDLPRGKSKYVRAFDAKMVLKRKIKPVEENRSTKNSGHQLSALQKVIPGLDRANSSSLIALRLAPLPDFTVYPENVKPQNVNYRFLPLQLLKILIWPRNYTITKDHKLSPFIRTIRKDKNGITLDNPSVEAIIDFKWRAARNHFIRHCILYSSFALLFGVITGAVKNKFFTQHQKDSYVLLRYPDEIGVAPDGNQYQYIDPATNATVSIDAYYQL
ncbi:8196_t:CDS:2, partial [Entrophospora sp. SA101]